MSNAFSSRIGVTVEEGISNAVSLDSNISTRNIGLAVERERGLVGIPTLVTSPKEDKRLFGGHDPSMYSSYVVENLFNNAGGYPVNVYQSRVVGVGCVASSIAVMQGVTEAFKVRAGRAGVRDVGTWGNALRFRIYPMGNANGSGEGYLAEVVYKGYLVETFTSVGASLVNLAEQINQRSEFIMVEGTALSTVITTVFDGMLVGGVYVAPLEANFNPVYNAVTLEAEGIAVFDNVDVQIIACPEIFSVNFAKACEAFAKSNLKLFIFVMPYLATEAVVETYYNALSTPDQSFTAGYLEWVEVMADNLGNKIWIPQTGYILGAGYIKKAGLNNGDVWTPPAGVDTNSKGIFRFTHQDLNDDRQSRFVKKWRCNVTKYIKNIGFCSWSSRTYSNNSLFESIHVRLETNWLVKSVETRNQPFMQKIISPSLQKSILSSNLIWFKNLYERGGIEQSIDFSDAVIIEIEVSKENRKEAEMTISWIPPECLEHMHIRFNRNDGVLITNF